MSNAVKYAFVFTVGAAIGSAVAWKLSKTKYERIAQEEIDSVKEVFANRYESATVNTVVEEEEECTGSVSEYEEQLRKYSAERYSNASNVNTKAADTPYVIPPELFGEMDDYDRITLNYYSDFVLTDELNELVEDVDATIGSESLDSFGEYEEDCVYVRNDRLKCDYEILWREKKYSDVIQEQPHRAEG